MDYVAWTAADAAPWGCVPPHPAETDATGAGLTASVIADVVPRAEPTRLAFHAGVEEGFDPQRWERARLYLLDDVPLPGHDCLLAFAVATRPVGEVRVSCAIELVDHRGGVRATRELRCRGNGRFHIWMRPSATEQHATDTGRAEPGWRLRFAANAPSGLPYRGHIEVTAGRVEELVEGYERLDAVSYIDARQRGATHREVIEAMDAGLYGEWGVPYRLHEYCLAREAGVAHGQVIADGRLRRRALLATGRKARDGGARDVDVRIDAADASISGTDPRSGGAPPARAPTPRPATPG